MTKIEGTWYGSGFEVNSVVANNVSNVVTLRLKLTLTFTHIHENVYNVKAVYIFADSGAIFGLPFKCGDINYQANFLINKSGNKFISEDDSGNGIDYFEFDGNKLEFGYNTNGLDAPVSFPAGNVLSQVGKYKLKKC